jgi:hypothetical protein
VVTAIRFLRSRLAAIAEAGVLLGSVALIAYGASLAYPPAASIVAGILLIVGIILRARGAEAK